MPPPCAAESAVAVAPPPLPAAEAPKLAGSAACDRRCRRRAAPTRGRIGCRRRVASIARHGTGAADPAACCRRCRRGAAPPAVELPIAAAAPPLPPLTLRLSNTAAPPTCVFAVVVAPPAERGGRGCRGRGAGAGFPPPTNNLKTPPAPPVAVAFAEAPIEETALADAFAAPPPPGTPSGPPPSPPVAFADALAMPPFVAVALAFAVALPPSPEKPAQLAGRRRRRRWQSCSNWRRRQCRSPLQWRTPSRFRPAATGEKQLHRRARGAAGRRSGCADAAVGGRAGCVRCRGRIPALAQRTRETAAARPAGRVGGQIVGGRSRWIIAAQRA